MAAIDGLAEVAGAAAEAEATARSVVWQDAAAVDAARARVSKALSRDRESLGRPRISAVEASPPGTTGSPRWSTRAGICRSALVLYLLLTVLAVSLADLPRIRRVLLREMVDYRSMALAKS